MVTKHLPCLGSVEKATLLLETMTEVTVPANMLTTLHWAPFQAGTKS